MDHGVSKSGRCEQLVVRGIEKLSLTCGVLAALMILVSIAITCQMIWMRFVMNASTIWQTEAVTYLMISATLIGLPYVQLLKGHVNVDLVPMMLRPVWRKVLALIVLSLSILVIAIMTYHGYELFHTAWERNWRSESIWGVRLWIPYLALPVGLGMFVLQMLADLIAAWRCDTEVLGHGQFEEDY